MKLSYANVVATLALFFALGGTALAGSRYLITSTSQIKPSVLKKLKGNGGPMGPMGPAGAGGSQGPAGSAGAPGAASAFGAPTVVKKRFGVEGTLPGLVSNHTIACPEGFAVGGGVDIEPAPQAEVVTTAPAADDRGWTIGVKSSTGSIGETTGYVVCLP